MAQSQAAKTGTGSKDRHRIGSWSDSWSGGRRGRGAVGWCDRGGRGCGRGNWRRYCCRFGRLFDVDVHFDLDCDDLPVCNKLI